MALWGKTDDANGAPKFLTSAELTTTFFADTTEAQVAANRAKGLQTPGWNRYTTYTDSTGATRNKAECLVVMKVAAATSGDALDDTTLADV